MTFLRPEFLYGLFAIVIPIIIHLFNFRRHKTLYFSDISRLKTVTTQTRKKQKLKQLIVLLLRILTIIFIVIAIAGPILKQKNTTSLSDSHAVTLYVDNSYSMMSEGLVGRLFESARQNALDIVNQNPDNTNFIILSNKPGVSSLRLLDKESAISILEEMEIASDVTNLSQIINTQNRILEKNESATSKTYLISDFQVNTSDISNFPEDSINDYTFIPLKHLNNKNIYIDSCAITSPDLMLGKVVDLSVWIKNDSDTDYEKVPLKLSINDQQKAVAGIDIKSGTTKKISLNFTISNTGWQYGLVEIEDFPITFDDRLNFAFNVIEDIKVLIVSGGNNTNYLRNFYSSDEVFNVSEMDYMSVELTKLQDKDLIILDEVPTISSGLAIQFKQFIAEGGNLLYIPPNEKYTEDISVFLKEMGAGRLIGIDTTSTRVTKLKLSSQLFSESIIKIPQNAELPTVNKHYTYVFPANSGVETLVSLLSGGDFLSSKSIGSGQLFILSVGLNNTYGNFTSQLLFSPIMHGIASKRRSVNSLYYTLGSTKNINLAIGNLMTGDKPATLINQSTNQTIIPGQRIVNNSLLLDFNNIILKNGYYNLQIGDSLIGALAFNFNRDESDMRFLSSDQINQFCIESGIKNYGILDESDPNFKEVINALQKESDFWKLFIIFALSVLLLEILVLRYWKEQ